MATATSTKQVVSTVTETVTEMVPVTKEVTREVTKTINAKTMTLNFRSKGNNADGFNYINFGTLISALQASGASFTIRVKASKDVDANDTRAGKELVKFNNDLIRKGKAAGTPARKDKPDTPTKSCNDCTNCTK